MAIYDLIVLKDAEFADVHDHGLVLAHSSLAAFDKMHHPDKWDKRFRKNRKDGMSPAERTEAEFQASKYFVASIPTFK